MNSPYGDKYTLKASIYKIPCGSCDKVYMGGQTGRTLEHRLREHKKTLTSVDCLYNTSAVPDHTVSNNHSMHGAKRSQEPSYLLA